MDWADVFTYDPASPTGLRNRVSRWGGKDFATPVAVAGEVAGCVGPDSYCRVSFYGELWSCHQIIWEMHNGYLADGQVLDHKDGDRSNNQIDNLRAVTEKVNQRNKKMPVTNTSGVVGVRFFETVRRGKAYQYWRAFWNDSKTGKYESKDFSIAKMGDTDAFTAACMYRLAKIEQMNRDGAGYSERHGGK